MKIVQITDSERYYAVIQGHRFWYQLKVYV